MLKHLEQNILWSAVFSDQVSTISGNYRSILFRKKHISDKSWPDVKSVEQELIMFSFCALCRNVFLLGWFNVYFCTSSFFRQLAGNDTTHQPAIYSVFLHLCTFVFLFLCIFFSIHHYVVVRQCFSAIHSVPPAPGAQGSHRSKNTVFL